MSTEDIKVKDGRITVERIGEKQNVDVAVSDVDSVTYARGWALGPGALILHTDDGDVVIRVDHEDAGDALALVNGAIKKESATEVKQKPAVTANK
jgi:hypothetical protein